MSRSERERQKSLQDKHQVVLSDLLRDEDNKYCVDCDAKGPRWASWNLGIFLCIRCAGIHRNLGVHITKVKSVNLDSWTIEQLAMVQEIGNSRARAIYEANLPDGFRRPQTDSSLEAFIRAKYEHKKYIAKEWVPPKPKPKLEVIKAKEAATEKKKSRPKTSGVQIQKSASKSRPVVNSDVSKTQPKVKTDIKTEAPQASADLLGLDTPGPTIAVTASNPTPSSSSSDLFGDFLSTPVVQNTQNNTQSTAVVNGTNTEQTDLFGAEEDKSKTTKDSILALYGPPKTTQQPAQPQAYGGMFSNQPNYNAVNMMGVPQQQSMLGNTMMQQPHSMLHQQQPQPMMNYAGMQQQPASGMVGQTNMMAGHQLPPGQGQMPQSNMYNNMVPYPQQQAQYLNQVQSQLANMSMNEPSISGYMPQQSAVGVAAGSAGTHSSWGQPASANNMTNSLWQ